MVKRAKGRPVDGILILNKPTGMSSNFALQKAKRLFNARKAGHTGALDPLATGLLPVCFGEATKFSQFLLDADKGYKTTARLGVRTDSSDADGIIVEEQPAQHITREDIEAQLPAFRGEISQVPSMFSALKYQGQPLYKLARQGKTIAVKPRNVTIYDLELTRFHSPDVELRVRCSKGTYIRSLVEDLGLALGCGAHVKQLHRWLAGPSDASQMVTFNELEARVPVAANHNPPVPSACPSASNTTSAYTALDALLLPVDTAVLHLTKVQLPSAQIMDLQCGKKIKLDPSPYAIHQLVRIYDETNTFIGVGEVVENDTLRVKRLLQTQPT